MKKFILVMLAAVMAIGFSAFTSAPEKEKATRYWYNSAIDEFFIYEGSQECEPGDLEPCIVTDIPGQGQVPLLKSENVNDVLMTDPQ
ncbi:MAG TPA: DUF6520 family protein [Flavobacterium sp.]|nr:DUF6520 family protein [Flavobacterium sp.]